MDLSKYRCVMVTQELDGMWQCRFRYKGNIEKFRLSMLGGKMKAAALRRIKKHKETIRVMGELRNLYEIYDIILANDYDLEYIKELQDEDMKKAVKLDTVLKGLFPRKSFTYKFLLCDVESEIAPRREQQLFIHIIHSSTFAIYVKVKDLVHEYLNDPPDGLYKKDKKF